MIRNLFGKIGLFINKINLFHKLKLFLDANPQKAKLIGIIALALIVPLTVVATLTIQNLKQYAGGGSIVNISDQSGNTLYSTSNPNVFIDLNVNNTNWVVQGAGVGINNLVTRAYAVSADCAPPYSGYLGCFSADSISSDSICTGSCTTPSGQAGQDCYQSTKVGSSCNDNGVSGGICDIYGDCVGGSAVIPTSIPTPTQTPIQNTTPTPAYNPPVGGSGPINPPPYNPPPVVNSPVPTPTTKAVINGRFVDQNGNLLTIPGQKITIQSENTNPVSIDTSPKWTLDFSATPAYDLRFTVDAIPGYTISHSVCQNCDMHERFTNGNTFGTAINAGYNMNVVIKYTPSTSPSPAPAPSILRAIYIENKDTDGSTGGSAPVKITINSATDIANIPWRLNDLLPGQTQAPRIVQVTLIGDSDTVPYVATINLIQSDTPPPPISAPISSTVNAIQRNDFDLIRDGTINCKDIEIIVPRDSSKKGTFGLRGTNVPGDVDRNGVVDGVDLNAIYRNFTPGNTTTCTD